MKYYTLYLDESTVEEIRKEGKKVKRNLSNYVDFLLSQSLKNIKKANTKSNNSDE